MIIKTIGADTLLKFIIKICKILIVIIICKKADSNKNKNHGFKENSNNMIKTTNFIKNK